MIDSKKRGLLQILTQVLVLYMPSLFGFPILFFVCALSLFVRTPYLHMGSALHFDHSEVCSSCFLCPLYFWFAPLVLCVLSLFGLPLLFFVCSLFLVCPSCSLCALSFWFAPLVLWVLSLSLYLCAHHIFTWALLCTSTTPRFATFCFLCPLSFWFAPLVLCVLSLFGFPLLFFMCSLFLVCPSC